MKKKLVMKKDGKQDITLNEFSSFVKRIVNAKPKNNLKGLDYNPTKKELEQKFRYDKKTQKIVPVND